MTENREVKSDVFSMLMQEKKYALEVYNALNGSHYDDPEMVEIIQLERGISLTIRNDASFIVDMNLSLYEHQSTYNPNMPLRFLIYCAEILKGYVKIKDYDLFGRRQIKLPVPKFAVFYNGGEKRPEIENYKLSDSYAHEIKKPQLELECTVYNINCGKNKDFLNECNVLSEYMTFIEIARENTMKGIDDPIEAAVDYCIENNILKDFLKANREGVLKNMVLDMTWEVRERLIRRDEREEGLIEGREAGERIGYIKAFLKDMITKENAILLSQLTEEEFDRAVKEYKEKED